MIFTRPALVLLVLGLAGTAYALRPRPERQRIATKSRFEPVRNAGPEEMAIKPSNWSLADEISDESFPASDPPSTY
jgi:hypothetical protein